MFMDELDRLDRVRNNLRLALPRRLHDFHRAMRQICTDDPIDDDVTGVEINIAAMRRRPISGTWTRRTSSPRPEPDVNNNND